MRSLGFMNGPLHWKYITIKTTSSFSCEEIFAWIWLKYLCIISLFQINPHVLCRYDCKPALSINKNSSGAMLQIYTNA